MINKELWDLLKTEKHSMLMHVYGNKPWAEKLKCIGDWRNTLWLSGANDGRLKGKKCQSSGNQYTHTLLNETQFSML